MGKKTTEFIFAGDPDHNWIQELFEGFLSLHS